MASKKRKGLPFVVQPRLQPVIETVGSEESGKVEIARKGYLTVAEKSITQHATSGDDSLRTFYALAGKIARENGKQQTEVLKDLSEASRPDYCTPYEDEVMRTMVGMMEFQEKLTIIQATALLICRIDSEWTVEETMELHPDILSGLAALYVDEDNQSVEALEAASSSEASEGK